LWPPIGSTDTTLAADELGKPGAHFFDALALGSLLGAAAPDRARQIQTLDQLRNPVVGKFHFPASVFSYQLSAISFHYQFQLSAISISCHQSG